MTTKARTGKREIFLQLPSEGKDESRLDELCTETPGKVAGA